MTHSARRINDLATRLNARTYLEIGVNAGNTFRLVDVLEKTGVDPDFRFDVDAVRNDRTRLIAETSDAYFASLPVSVKFDVVFIDGLHSFEQVVKDFSNTVIHTHDRSVIVLDDTVPNDVFSTLPTSWEAAEFRIKFGNSSRDWHGDVFKSVFYINDFWPGMNYRTMVTGGNAQTLVWRSAAIAHQPVFGNLEAISRLSFFDLQKNMSALRSTDEEDAIAQCIAGIVGQ